MERDREFIKEFVIECREGLDRIDTDLVALEASPDDKARLNSIFRTLHTIKGNSGFLELTKTGTLAHAGETLLNQLRSGEMPMTSRVADLLMRLVDGLRRLIAEIEATTDEAATEVSQLVDEAIRYDPNSQAGATAVEPSTELAEERERSGFTSTLLDEDDLAATTSFQKPSAQSSLSPAPPVAVGLGKPVAPLKPAAEPITPVQPLVVPVNPQTAPPQVQAKAKPPVLETQPSPKTEQSDHGSSFASESILVQDPELSTIIRVPIDHLDHLMNLVGELVQARNRIVQIAANRSDDELLEPVQRLNTLTTELQAGVMRTRMQPVRNAWRKYPRIVRDLGKQCGKQVQLDMQGGDTELDKSMLETIADPLVHLVRNAIDHGIEKPYLRKIKGKPETGHLVVRAFQETGQVHIEVSDDGAGLDLERIRKKAVDAGIVAADRAMVISESELRNSVFLPGFTTADRVTELSGRGVGMDVVKTHIERIGGTIELQTRKDVGTTVRLTVPLTLAIVPAFVVICGGQRFAIPQINVAELLRLRGDEMAQAYENYHDTPVLRLREELLPIADLSARLGTQHSKPSSQRETLDILVLKTGSRRFALLVDELGDAQEIVVRPLGVLFSNRPEYSGAALMGDGQIALILDALGLARSCGLLASEQTLLSGPVTVRDEMPQFEDQVLICQVNGSRQIALPLSNVIRLEQIPLSAIESSSAGNMVQYRGNVLPIRQMAQIDLNTTTTIDADNQPLVIYRTSVSQIGLLVDRILEVIPRPVELQPVTLDASDQQDLKVTSTAIVLGRITDFVEATP